LSVEIVAPPVVTLAGAAQLARQVAFAYDDGDRDCIHAGLGYIVEVLDRFEQLAARSGWSGPAAELFPVERTVLP
jgi:hypothetical protein